MAAGILIQEDGTVYVIGEIKAPHVVIEKIEEILPQLRAQVRQWLLSQLDTHDLEVALDTRTQGKLEMRDLNKDEDTE